jgi:hypothetical protein
MGDGTLMITTPFGAMRLVQVDSLLFRDVNSGTRVAFRADAAGRITHAFYDATPMMVMDRTNGLGRPAVHQAILGGGLLMFLAIVLTAIVRFFIRNTPGRPRVEPSIVNGRRALTWAGLLLLVFIGLLVSLVSNPDDLLGPTPTMLKVAPALPVMALVLVLWVHGDARAVARGRRSVWMRLRHTGAILGARLLLVAEHRTCWVADVATTAPGTLGFAASSVPTCAM